MKYGIWTVGTAKEPGYEGLAVAIVEQAVDDWRYLCNGGKETGRCNYGELQYFIETQKPISADSKCCLKKGIWKS